MVVTQKLLDYIKKQLEKGHDHGIIKEILIDAGYYIGDIEEAFKQMKSETKKPYHQRGEEKELPKLSKPRFIKKTEELKPAILGERAKIGFCLAFLGSIMIFLEKFIELLIVPDFMQLTFNPFFLFFIELNGFVLATMSIFVAAVALLSSFVMYRRGSEVTGGSLAIATGAIYLLLSTGFMLGPVLILAGGIAGVAKK